MADEKNVEVEVEVEGKTVEKKKEPLPKRALAFVRRHIPEIAAGIIGAVAGAVGFLVIGLADEKSAEEPEDDDILEAEDGEGGAE